jgi:CRISPR/Cas system-associated protein endoribonuclease Cas2
MKLKEIAQKKPSQGKSLKLLITESQFKRLAENIVLLQEQNQIENTHLLKISRNINK